jgi:ligand-binding sensor domain-containing protein
MIKFFKKYHRWAGIVLVLLMILFSISGIIMNHRQTFSGINIPRKFLPEDYTYKNWNLAAVRSTEKINGDSILMYGNIGVWLTDSTGSYFTDYNKGFPIGIDNRKIFKVIHRENGTIVAGTLFGLYRFSPENTSWNKIDIPGSEENIVDLLQKNDSLFVLTRSNLFLTKDLKRFETIELPAPAGFDNKAGLFKTLWVIHSGAIYGQAGKLLVDFVALIFIFLSVGGFILFLNKKALKRKQLSKPSRHKIKKQYKWHLRWHNKIGWITILLLFITASTGIFLRPPLLAAIADVKVRKIPFTDLDTPNPWYDILRRIIYIENKNSYIISTSEGFYYSEDDFNSLKNFDSQPPASVMGVTVLEEKGMNILWVGSFEGLYSWNYETGEVYDIIDKKVWVKPLKKGPPIGNHKISGYSRHFHNQSTVFDYDKGTKSPFNKLYFPEMTEEIIQKTPMSLWNVSQEIHTGRFYRFFMGNFYILVVPLTGILTLLMLVSGFVIWYKHHRKKKLNHLK